MLYSDYYSPPKMLLRRAGRAASGVLRQLGAPSRGFSAGAAPEQHALVSFSPHFDTDSTRRFWPGNTRLPARAGRAATPGPRTGGRRTCEGLSRPSPRSGDGERPVRPPPSNL